MMNILAYVHLRNILNSTGAGRVARQLTEHLAKQSDARLHILADPADHKQVVHRIGHPWTEFRYHFMRRETSKQQARWYVFENPKAENYWPEAQIVFCTAESYVPTTRLKLAVTLHDAAYFERGVHHLDLACIKQRLKWTLLFRTLARHADLFHTVSRFSAERLSHYFPAIRSRLRIVHNGIAPLFFGRVSDGGHAWMQESGMANREYVLLVGGLHYRKNADLVLKAWPLLSARHPELLLVVAGHCTEQYAEEAKRLGSTVKLTGFVQDETLHALYSSAQTVWFPSLYEGFGMPVLEAMACGTPVVASDSSSLPEVSGGAAVLVSPHRPDEHADAIDSLLRNPQIRKELSGKGRAHARAFTWEASAAGLRRHFEEII
jgi:glycosyltransferase involved in cell wall biosynthesis